ncbi:MAG: DNA repair protein RadC [Firmicutes bacterium]|nr:DNA repair protein RadC [Bacillota bacterium]
MDNPHKGHRERMRRKYLNDGLDNFEDHEILEILLYYCIPMKNTNELAHRLIAEFGSLPVLFESDPVEIKRRGKVSEATAVLLSMIPSLTNRYFMSKWTKNIRIDSSELAGTYAMSLFAGKNVELFYLICLDSQRKLIHAAKISEGTVDETPVYIREINHAIIRYKAASVILAHNHPGGSTASSASDREATKKIMDAAGYMNVEVVDHIIVAGDKYSSFAAKGLFGMGY